MITQLIDVNVKYTDAQLKDLANDLTAKIDQIADLEQEKKDWDKAKKAQIDTATAEMFEIAGRHKSGYKVVSVDCELRINREKGLREWIATNSANGFVAGDVVKSEPMKKGDAQIPMEMPSGEAPVDDNPFDKAEGEGAEEGAVEEGGAEDVIMDPEEFNAPLRELSNEIEAKVEVEAEAEAESDEPSDEEDEDIKEVGDDDWDDWDEDEQEEDNEESAASDEEEDEPESEPETAAEPEKEVVDAGQGLALNGHAPPKTPLKPAHMKVLRMVKAHTSTDPISFSGDTRPTIAAAEFLLSMEYLEGEDADSIIGLTAAGEALFKGGFVTEKD